MEPPKGCPHCGGTGHVPSADELSWEKCHTCSGTFVSNDGSTLKVSGIWAHEVRDVLTEGIDRMTNNPVVFAPQPKTDVVILAALQKELAAFLRHFPGSQEMDEAGRVSFVASTGNGLRVRAMALDGMGQLHAALAAKDALVRYDPSQIILLGIAAGIGKDVGLGDILVSDQIIDYELAKVGEDGTQTRWTAYRSSPSLIQSIQSYQGNRWVERVNVARPDDSKGRPHIHVGAVFSGNKIIASAAEAGKLRAIYDRAIGIEMEAAGIAAALHHDEHAARFVMVKGVCDRADAMKDDRWQEYAAEVSAAFVADLLGLHIQRDSLSSEVTSDRKDKTEMELLDVLKAAYNLAELEELAYRLNIEWEDVRADTKTVTIIRLVSYAKRRGLSPQLATRVRAERSALFESHSS